MNSRYPKIAKISIIFILIGLIRCIGEFFRLEYVLGEHLTIILAKPFIIGAMAAAIGLALMIVLFFYSKHRLVAVAAILTITVMLCIKYIYAIP